MTPDTPNHYGTISHFLHQGMAIAFVYSRFKYSQCS